MQVSRWSARSGLHAASLTWGQYSLWQVCHRLEVHEHYADLDTGACLPPEPDAGEVLA